jgi:hypothetical protein
VAPAHQRQPGPRSRHLPGVTVAAGDDHAVADAVLPPSHLPRTGAQRQPVPVWVTASWPRITSRTVYILVWDYERDGTNVAQKIQTLLIDDLDGARRRRPFASDWTARSMRST